MPRSVAVGSRPPSSCLIFSNSSGVSPCSRIISGVMAEIAAVVMMGKFYCRILNEFLHGDLHKILGGLGAGFALREELASGARSTPTFLTFRPCAKESFPSRTVRHHKTSPWLQSRLKGLPSPCPEAGTRYRHSLLPIGKAARPTLRSSD